MIGFLERIRDYKDDRGMMANLRCILVENKMHRAWPALNRIGVRIGDDISAFVAGLYATHYEGDDNTFGNLGETCRHIQQKRRESINHDSKLSPTERRFQHLLAAERGKELKDRVLRMVLLAKSQGVSINYEQLMTDMKFWSDRIKIQWAEVFWGQDENRGEE